MAKRNKQREAACRSASSRTWSLVSSFKWLRVADSNLTGIQGCVPMSWLVAVQKVHAP
jgi:hypothetical protein